MEYLSQPAHKLLPLHTLPMLHITEALGAPGDCIWQFYSGQPLITEVTLLHVRKHDQYDQLVPTLYQKFVKMSNFSPVYHGLPWLEPSNHNRMN